MASVQVMSNSAVFSRKQEHLEAGKRRLEEFRKKKTAAKKAVSISQPRSAVSTVTEKQTSQNGHAQFVDSAGAAAAADGGTESATVTSGFLVRNDKSLGFAHNVGSDSLPVAHVNPESHDLLQMNSKHEGNSHDIRSLKSQTGLINSKQTDDRLGKFITDNVEGKYTNVISSGGHIVPQDDNKSYFHPSFYGVEDRKPSNSMDKLSSFYIQQASEPISAGFNSDVSGSFNGSSCTAVPETLPRRSRPSFLDSLNISRESPASGQFFSEKEKFMTSKFSSSNSVVSTSVYDHSTSTAPVKPLPTPASQNPSADLFGSAIRGQVIFENSLENKRESNFQKQNEDFAALEQHIEDLTQEKFSLQHALEASKALSESLATENSSLTESYNQQASIVDQLKAEMEKLHGEIKARLVELESFKAEYMNAQFECNAADERAKLLASEVIGLEEKALRFRSSELKLEKELENSSAEIASYRKKLSSLEKDCQDLLHTIDALQEEKKLLQTKLRGASSGGVSIDINKGHTKKDVSTSTNDLAIETAGADSESSQQVPSNTQVHEDAENLLLLGHNGSAFFEDSAMSIPPDQMQMIQNINSLISEVMAEKEELIQALVTEVSTSTKLKDMNKELSHKLEVQTQRLELLTAQSMANENIPTKQPTTSHIVRESVAYADEGDEVVERVLGWIMKLFPGGPSKRRTSRL